MLIDRLYGVAGIFAAPLLRLMLWRRQAGGKEIAERVAERFGIAGLPRPAGRLVWLHAASVGETMSVLPVIDALAGQCEVLLTTGTVTSARLAETRLPPHARHQFVPLDVPAWVARFLTHWRPDCAVFVESEIWPALLRGLDSRGIPRLLINASLSARSAARWGWFAKFADILVFGFRWIHVQSVADADKFTRLGAGGVLDWGNLKYAAPPLPCDDTALAELRRRISGPVWLAASTHEGEETVVIAAHQRLLATYPTLVTIIAPRHPARGAGFEAPRRSLEQPPVGGQIYLADTLGELGLFYRLAPFAFIGGSLADLGGHNLTEAAKLGIPVITGPFTGEITNQVEKLQVVAGIEIITDAAELAAAVAAWLQDPAAAAASGAAAQTVFAGLEALPGRLAERIMESTL